MIKMIAAILVSVIGYLVGQNYAEHLRNKVSVLEKFILMVDKTEYLVRNNALDLYEIFDLLRKNVSLKGIKLIRCFPETFDPDTDIRKQMHTLIEKDFELSAEERELLHRFADQIGSSDQEGQAVFLSGLRAELVQLRDSRRAEFHEKSRLFKAVGLLCGAMAGILII